MCRIPSTRCSRPTAGACIIWLASASFHDYPSIIQDLNSPCASPTGWSNPRSYIAFARRSVDPDILLSSSITRSHSFPLIHLPDSSPGPGRLCSICSYPLAVIVFAHSPSILSVCSELDTRILAGTRHSWRGFAFLASIFFKLFRIISFRLRALGSIASLRFASLNPPPARSFLAKYYDTRAGVASAVCQMLLRLLYQTLLVIPLVYLLFHCILVNADADFESVRVRLSYDHSGKAGDPSQKYFRK